MDLMTVSLFYNAGVIQSSTCSDKAICHSVSKILKKYEYSLNHKFYF